MGILDRAGKIVVSTPQTPARVARRFRAGSLESRVQDRVVMITGASSGIGQAAAVKVGAAGGKVLLVARTREKLEETRDRIVEAGGVADVLPCDLTDLDDIDRMAAEALERHERVDILVNNAGRSIRRSIARSYDRMHDFQRTMQLNYFGAVKLILCVLPGMRERQRGHIINVSTAGVHAHVPRFSAYLASKSALDAFSASIASEIRDDRVRITTIYMPLVRTPMIEPTKLYQSMPALTPEEAGDMIADAIVTRPKHVTPRFGQFLQLAYAVNPNTVDAVVNRAYHLFPDSRAARNDGALRDEEKLSGRARLFGRLLRGPHW
jgi:short-subunit dehydrogenase